MSDADTTPTTTAEEATATAAEPARQPGQVGGPKKTPVPSGRGGAAGSSRGSTTTAAAPAAAPASTPAAEASSEATPSASADASSADASSAPAEAAAAASATPAAADAAAPPATAAPPAAPAAAAPPASPTKPEEPKPAPRKQVGPADFDILDQLGEGAFGQVCLCRLKSTGAEYAIKIIEGVHAKRHGGLQQVKNERDVLILLQHPSVIKLHFTFHDAEHLYIVLELASGGELFSHIKRLGACHINCARWLTGELVNVLEYMHGKGVVHRDLKPENILLDDLGHIKLVDFGSARRLDVEDHAAKFVGTAQYVSPEVLNDDDAMPAADMWALGCIAFQMLSGSPPFIADSEYLIFKRIEELDYTFPDHFPPSAQALVSSLLSLDPTARPAADASLKAHPFFQDCDAPLDFASIISTPPPPLVPPPPAPVLEGDSIINANLADHSLEPADRRELVQRQRGTRWAAFAGPDEVIVLATATLKRRHLSVKRRHLLLIDCVVDAVESARLLYVDPDAMELKGSIPWSAELNAELMPKGCFRVHVPGRTYYLEDAEGKQETAELWVRTLMKLRARIGGGSNGGGGGSSPDSTGSLMKRGSSSGKKVSAPSVVEPPPLSKGSSSMGSNQRVSGDL